MRTFYITGISGFLGRNIVLSLLNEPDVEIIGLVLPNEKNLEFYYQYENITLVEGNILNKDDVIRFISSLSLGEKVVIHAAGRISVFRHNDDLTMKINVDGTKNVVDACLELGDIDKFIYVSSVDALPKLKDQLEVTELERYDENLVDGVYSKSKAISNNYVLDAVKKGLNASIVMPSAIMGPNDPFHAPINVAIKKFLKHKLPAVVKGGYDIVDVRDVAEGIIAVSEHGKIGESYILNGHQTRVLDLINLAAKKSKNKPIKSQIPHFLVKIASPFIELHARIHHQQPLFTAFAMDCLLLNPKYSNKKASNDFNYHPRSLEITMEDTINWMKDSGYLAK